MVVKTASKAGLRDWLIQRVSAIIIGLYTLFIVIYLLANPSLAYAQWHHLFQGLPMRIITLLVVLTIVWHAWIGLWTVLTDYVKNTSVRVIVQGIIIILLAAYIISSIDVLWSAGSGY